jgi:hypothetical protein
MVKKQLVLTGVANEAGSTSHSSSKKVKAVRFDPVVQNIEGWVVYVDPQMLDRELFLHIDELRPDLPCRGML